MSARSCRNLDPTNSPPGGEGDLRACYTAMAVTHMIALEEGDKEELLRQSGLVQYVRACQVGLLVLRESHPWVRNELRSMLVAVLVPSALAPPFSHLEDI